MTPLTDEIYRASLDPARLALITGSPTGPFANLSYAALTAPGWATKESLAAGAALLAAAQLTGLPIDTQLMLWGWSAPMIMQVRLNNGYAYVPPYGTANVDIAPGLSVLGQSSNYPASMPAGWIKVSVDAADYPAYVPPIPVTTPPPIWTPVMSEVLSAVDPTTGTMHYYFGLSSGQNPAYGTTCTFNGLNFVCAPYQGQSFFGMTSGVLKMWMLKTA
jgi:hypothetical protein